MRNNVIAAVAANGHVSNRNGQISDEAVRYLYPEFITCPFIQAPVLDFHLRLKPVFKVIDKCNSFSERIPVFIKQCNGQNTTRQLRSRDGAFYRTGSST